MARKRTKVSRNMLLVWFVLAGFIFLFAPERVTGKFQLAFNDVFSKPISMGRSLSLSVQATEQQPQQRFEKEYQYLNHIANLEEKLRIERQKVQKLVGLRQRYDWEGVSFVLADIYRTSSEDGTTQVLVNRGKSDGLQAGQYVLAENSVVGIVSEVSTRAARIRLITDPDCRIVVRIADTNRVMQGSGNGLARVEMLSVEHKLSVGDQVFAAPQPGYLESPIVAGSVKLCQRDDQNPLMWDLRVESACDLAALTSVAVLVPAAQQQQ